MAIWSSAVESLNQYKKIRLSKSCLGKEEKKAVLDVLDNEYLGMGSEVESFESALSDFFGRPTICVANGTSALQLSLQACGLTFNDEVLVQSLTYVASFQAISATGAIPVACDINKESLTIDLNDAQKKLTPKTKAIMPVHYGGNPGNLSAIYAFAKKNHLRVIEDAAHAFGSDYKNKRIGSFGDIACFSFDGIKNITSGEGGCIVTSDKLVLGLVRNARLLGVQEDTEKRYKGERSWEFEVVSQGWRYHMSNVMAAIGIEQLKKFPKMAAKRRMLAAYYDKLLKGDHIVDIFPREYKNIVPHIYVVRINGLKNRDALRVRLLEFGIETGIHYQPNHMLSFYSKDNGEKLPTVESIFPELISLPLHPDLHLKDIKFIVDSLLSLTNDQRT